MRCLEMFFDYAECNLSRTDPAVFFDEIYDFVTWVVSYVEDFIEIWLYHIIAENLKRWLRQQFIVKYLGHASEVFEIYLVYE